MLTWLRERITLPRHLFDRRTARRDAAAGAVLGIESVPDGLASGLLAGVNPVAGLYGYLFGLAGGALFTGTATMAIQGTGAMAIIVADVDLDAYDDPVRALATLSILTGIVMIVAGALGLGRLLRFVSKSVMTGFISAVGISIVLGQLDNLTGYDSQGSNRVTAALDLLLHLRGVDLASLVVGLTTIAGILVLQRTRLGATGLVVAVAAGSALAAVLNALGSDTVALVADVAEVPGSLPLPVFPDLSATLDLLLPAAALAFVGMVQGAGVSAGFPNPDGTTSPSRDFIGQGAGNIASGLFRGVPVGGSMSATSLVVGAGARNRFALLVAAAVMAAVIILFAGVVELVAMPALAGLLIVVGVSTVKPAKLLAVGKTGPVPLTVMLTTLVLTLLMPLQYAVLVGVGLSVLLFVIGQSSRLVTRRLVMGADNRVIETNPPTSLGEREVVVLQPYGPIFFATATALRSQMPDLTPASRRSVVILRLRGADDAGATLLEVLGTYVAGLADLGSRLVIVTDNERLVRQLQTDDTLGSAGSVYQGTAVIWEATREAYDDAVAWVAQDTDEAGDRGWPSAGRTYRDPHEGDWPPDQMAL
ncbi:SulP family inorganic anion transporter [Nocardioides sp. NPDC059952]|uniref:SulP family inorganic anion transporter n=1 Tax=Nocardioides sp. NPDC059952 TaxID=3347014 RepID=UPI003651E8D4